jgi:NitT/TauT family transport system ATP-binding protein
MAYRLDAIRKSYGGIPVLAGVDLELERGSVTVILGPSGCGKTTLLNVMAGLVPFEGGSRSGFDEARFSYAFQEPRLLPWMNARENAAFALSGLMARDAALARVDALLEVAGLADARDLRPDQFSGGMRQRLSLVRAFAYPADILLLDEAFTSVDLRTKIDLMDAFLGLWKAERPTVVSVTHDVEESVYLADRVVVLSDRPARVMDGFAIPLEHEARSLGSAAAMDTEGRLYRLILGGAARK